MPYLLGFRPTSSLVLVGLAASRLVVTARIDLVDATDSHVNATIAAMVRSGTTDVIAAIHNDIERAHRARCFHQSYTGRPVRNRCTSEE